MEAGIGAENRVVLDERVAGQAAEGTDDRVIADLAVVALHVHDQWHIDSMRCNDGDAVLADFLWGHPTAMIDRVKFSGQNRVAMTSGNWKSKIAQRKLDPLDVTIGASSAYDMNSRSLTVTVNGAVARARAVAAITPSRMFAANPPSTRAIRPLPAAPNIQPGG